MSHAGTHATCIESRTAHPVTRILRAAVAVLLMADLLVGQSSRPSAAAQPTSRPAGRATRAREDLSDIELLGMEVPVTVTTGRREQDPATMSYPISVVTAEEIRRSGARSVPDALRLVPGVDVAELTYGATAVSPRGFHGLLSNGILVLVDGRQIFDTFYGGTFWGSWPFQLEDIEQIEVIRGPAGVIWGANAFNGVINIITKDPVDQLGLTTTGMGGSRGTQKEHVGYGFSDGKLRMRVSGEYEGSDGFVKGGSFINPQQDFYQAGRISLHGIYDAGPDDTLTFSAGNSEMAGAYTPSIAAGFTGAQRPRSQATFVLGNWRHRVDEDNEFTLSGFVNDFHAIMGYKFTDYRYQQIGLGYNHVLKPAENHTLTWGVEGRADLTDASNSNPYMLTQDFVSTGRIGLYLQDDWQFAPRWTFSLGGSIDYEFYGGFQPSARAALSYEFAENALVYGAVSRAFQMPTAATRKGNAPLFEGAMVYTGDPDMEAESLIAYELGVRKKWKRFELDANTFWHEYNEMTTMTPVLGPPGLLNARYDNHCSASMYGVELEGKWKVTSRFTLRGNYTYDVLNWDSSQWLQFKDVIRPPKHKFMIGAQYDPIDDLHLTANLFFVDHVRAPIAFPPSLSHRIPEYFRLDLRAEYEFWDRRASVAAGVRNLLDSSHPEGSDLFINDAEVPRTYYVEMRMTFR
jgi:iron complex outermembrane receptor protein